ncbi:MAG TPA: hypothetical protein VNT99_20355 [Methylomirabilota bacterium]|nr:hypothetical protein [Methylomirabilota bacterium]
MDIESHGKRYRTLRASDVERDGMALDLECGSDTLAEVFYSDVTGEFTISLFSRDLPLPVIEQFIAEARQSLVPVRET